MSNSAVQFFINELASLPPDRALYFKNNSAWLRCPQHAGGNEKTPSFTVNLDPSKKVPLGFCGCFGCGAKFPWNGLAELFNLKKITDGALKEAAASGVFRPPEDTAIRMPDLDKLLRWPSAPWRTIPGDIVKKYGGRMVMFRGELALYLPVMVYDEHVGGINALLEKPEDGSPAYINTFGAWSHAALFGFDQAAERLNEPLFIAEGPRDCLRLAEHGARAVSLIGSRVTPDKMNLIVDLDPPIVCVCTDPDEAGNNAAEELRANLSGVLPSVRVKMKKGTDPADLTRGQVTKFLRRLKQERLH